MRLIAAWFDRNVDAEAARAELAGLQDGLELKLRSHRLDQIVRPVGTHPVIVARVPARMIPVLRRIVARHHGRIVIDLDEADLRS